MVVGDDGDESLEEEWGLMQEYILNNMVHLHNQLFGSLDLVLRVSHLLDFWLDVYFINYYGKYSSSLFIFLFM